MDILNFYYIDLKYIRNLARADDNVMSVSPQLNKEKRPFLGIIVLIDGQKYCIPLTSPKKEFENMKSQIDFIKIFDHNSKHPEYSSKIIGILNLNNMIPVNNSVISKVNLKLSPHDTPDKFLHYQSRLSPSGSVFFHHDLLVDLLLEFSNMRYDSYQFAPLGHTDQCFIRLWQSLFCVQ